MSDTQRCRVCRRPLWRGTYCEPCIAKATELHPEASKHRHPISNLTLEELKELAHSYEKEQNEHHE